MGVGLPLAFLSAQGKDNYDTWGFSTFEPAGKPGLNITGCKAPPSYIPRVQGKLVKLPVGQMNFQHAILEK